MRLAERARVRRSFALAVASIALLAPSLAQAESALQLDTRYAQSRLYLGDLSMRPARGGRLDARALGLGTVTSHGGELAFLGRGGLFTFGPVFGVYGSGVSGGAGNATFDGLTMMRIAFESHVHHQFGSWLVDASVGAGGRVFFLHQAPSSGNCTTTMNTSSGTPQTNCSATAAVWSVVPRLSISYQPGLGEAKEPVLGTAIGAFVGTDVLRPGSLEAGVSLEFRLWLVPPGKTWNEMMKRWEAERAAKLQRMF